MYLQLYILYNIFDIYKYIYIYIYLVDVVVVVVDDLVVAVVKSLEL